MGIYFGNSLVSIERTVEKRKYGATAGSLLGDVDANGVLQMPSEATDLVFTGVKDVVTYGMYYKFYQNTGIKSVSFPDLESVSTTNAMSHSFDGSTALTSATFSKLTTVSGSTGLSYLFQDCTALTSAIFTKLTTVSGSNGMYYAFYRDTALTFVSMPELTTVSNSNGIAYLFRGCTSLASVTLSKLATLSGSGCASYLFYDCPISTFTFTALSNVSGSACLTGSFQRCKNLTSLYFPALTTTSFGSNVNQFNNLFNTGTSGTAATSGAFTVHFPSNLQSTISGLTGYPTFGATSSRITLLFDLPSTATS